MSGMPKQQNRQTGVVLAVGDDEMFTEGKSRIVPGAKIYFVEADYVNPWASLC